MKKTLENTRGAWVRSGETGEYELRWLDDDGNPAELMGVGREMDVPGALALSRANVLLSFTPEAQHAAKWPEPPAT